VQVPNLPRPARKRSLRRPRRSRGNAAFGGMPGAFCHGIVKNQQGLAAEVLKIGSGEKPATTEFRKKFGSQGKVSLRMIVQKLGDYYYGGCTGDCVS
jgi:hypothetical protein